MRIRGRLRATKGTEVLLRDQRTIRMSIISTYRWYAVKALHPVAIIAVNEASLAADGKYTNNVLKSSGTLRLGQVTGDTMTISFTCLQC